LIKALKEYFHQHLLPSTVKEKGVVEAYDMWSENYDSQPGNLMLDLDELLFGNWLNIVNLKDKNIADIGCGTGRHWTKILKKDPANLTGFDVSGGMLSKLNEKFPFAKTHIISDNSFSMVEDGAFDVIISTLTVAHIQDIEGALEAWSRMLKYKADIIITDFHPDALAFGGKRTFRHQNEQIAVRNFVHPLNIIKEILLRNGFYAANEDERRVDETVKHYYLEQNALPVFEKFKGFPIIYGIHFRRG
jgi:ubiquinone/menaquinone biosynthesis C-methylase UbiE